MLSLSPVPQFPRRGGSATRTATGAASTKTEILRAAERLFGERGFDGVSLREISAAAGSGNNFAVQYHFGSKEQLVVALFENRLGFIDERRHRLIAERRPDDLRSWVECYVLPLLEQGEMEGSHYMSFVATVMDQQSRLFDHLPKRFRQRTRTFCEQVAARMPQVPEPLRAHRIQQAILFSVHAASHRERAAASGHRVLPFALHATDLVDGLVGFLQAPASAAARASLDQPAPASRSWPFLL